MQFVCPSPVQLVCGAILPVSKLLAGRAELAPADEGGGDADAELLDWLSAPEEVPLPLAPPTGEGGEEGGADDPLAEPLAWLSAPDDAKVPLAPPAGEGGEADELLAGTLAWLSAPEDAELPLTSSVDASLVELLELLEVLAWL